MNMCVVIAYATPTLLTNNFWSTVFTTISSGAYWLTSNRNFNTLLSPSSYKWRMNKKKRCKISFERKECRLSWRAILNLNSKWLMHMSILILTDHHIFEILKNEDDVFLACCTFSMISEIGVSTWAPNWAMKKIENALFANCSRLKPFKFSCFLFLLRMLALEIYLNNLTLIKHPFGQAL